MNSTQTNTGDWRSEWDGVEHFRSGVIPLVPGQTYTANCGEICIARGRRRSGAAVDSLPDECPLCRAVHDAR